MTDTDSTTIKLSDTKRVILAHAATRDNRLVLPIPETIGTRGAALASILNGLVRQGLIKERVARTGEPGWGESENGRKVTLAITDKGLAAIGIEPQEEVDSDAAPADVPSPSKTPDMEIATAGLSSGSSPFTAGTKSAVVVNLLMREDGATIQDLMAASGWQAHSVRGFLSGTLRKKHELPIVSETGEQGERRYRIAS